MAKQNDPLKYLLKSFFFFFENTAMYLLVWVGSGACNSKGWAGTVDETFGSRIFIVSLEATFSVQLAESVTLEHVTHCRRTRSCYWSFAGRPIYVIRKKIFCKSWFLVYIWNLWHFAAWPTVEMSILIFLQLLWQVSPVIMIVFCCSSALNFVTIT